MKNLKKALYAGLLLTGLAGSIQAQNPTISDHFFGENAWMPDTIGDPGNCAEPPCILNGKLYQHWDNIKNSKASLIRFGGISADRNRPTNYQYIRMIDAIRTNGMEPVIQVPFANYRYTAQQAADIVHYINIEKGKNIKYWIIGNEPDLGYGFTNSSQIAGYFKAFASAMKAADPSILIIGPECAWFNNAIIDGLTNPNGPDDITGKDAAGRYYVDVISFHTYPFNGSQTRDQMVSQLTAAGELQDDLAHLNSRISAANTAHHRTGSAALKTAITEANVNWQNNGGDNASGLGANSFIGGQFVAEMLGIAMKNNVDFVNLWSVVEGNGVQNSIGYIDPATGNKKPLYQHFKMMAENFKGTYAPSTSNQQNVKSFACKDGEQVAVMLLNEDQGNNFNYTVRLSNGTINGNNALKVGVDAGLSEEYTGSIPAQSTLLLVFNSSGKITKKIEYSLNNHALANAEPTTTNYNPMGIASAAGQVPVELKNVYPNPSNGKFTVELNQPNTEEKEFEVKLINLIGQEVYEKKLKFTEGAEKIELHPDIASGTYILQVKEKDKDRQLTQKLMVQKK